MQRSLRVVLVRWAPSSVVRCSLSTSAMRHQIEAVATTQVLVPSGRGVLKKKEEAKE